MRRRTIVTVVLACVVAPAMGDYWVQYQPLPDAPWPEDQGWERITAYGGAQRSIEDGALVLDSHGSGGIVDYYRVVAPGMMHAEPDHPFVLAWSLKVEYTTAVTEVGVGVFSDDRWGLGFEVTSDRIYDAYAYPKSVGFEPGWHVFRMTTLDMRTYELTIDGLSTMAGFFDYDAGFMPSIVSWGDGGQGGVSLSRWSFAGFGIVPEPSMMLGMLSVLALVLRVSRRGRARR